MELEKTMFLTNIPPKHKLRWLQTPRGLILQELVEGRRDCKNFTAWATVPTVIDFTESEETKPIYSPDTVMD